MAKKTKYDIYNKDMERVGWIDFKLSGVIFETPILELEAFLIDFEDNGIDIKYPEIKGFRIKLKQKNMKLNSNEIALARTQLNRFSKYRLRPVRT